VALSRCWMSASGRARTFKRVPETSCTYLAPLTCYRESTTGGAGRTSNVICSDPLPGDRRFAPGVLIAHSHRCVGDRGGGMFRTIAVDKHCHRIA